MIPDEVGQQLHDRATRGDALSAQERQCLVGWYAAQDRAESQALSPRVLPFTHEALVSQTEAIMQQLTTATQNLRTISQENAALRREISELRQQLVHHVSPQPA